MTRKPLLALGLAAPGLLVPALLVPTLLVPTHSARAQAISTGVVVKREGETIDNNAKLYHANIEDCETNAEWSFSVTYPQQIPVVEAWVGTGSIDCTQTSNRSFTTNTQTKTSCWKVDAETSKTKVTLSAKTNEIFWAPSNRDGESDAGTDDAGTTTSTSTTLDSAAKCDSVAGTQPYVVYILPLSQATNPESNIVQAPIATLGALSTLKVTFTPYTKRPGTPSNVRAVPGESELGVKYDKDSANQATTTRYYALFDYGKDDQFECGSGTLEPVDGVVNLPPSNTPKLVASKKSNSDTSVIKDPDALGIAIGDVVAVSAVTVDPAGNPSLPSLPVCVERQNTRSAYDACVADPKCKAGLTTCSLEPVPARSLLAGLSITGLALAYALRRRRKASCAL